MSHSSQLSLKILYAFMAPNLSKIKRAELEQIIISKLQGEEKITDEAIGGTIVSCSTKTVQNSRSNILRYGNHRCAS